jgi:uncharacterized protein (TIGR02611 family)
MRFIRIAAGFILLAAGIVMLVLPGPGWITIAAGLAVLAAHFQWARRLLDDVKHRVSRIRETFHGERHNDVEQDQEQGDSGRNRRDVGARRTADAPD